jgi:hypothetical protein
MKTRRLVLVEWLESQGATPDWQAITDKDKPSIVVAKSVGWLVYDGKDCKRIVPHMVSPSANDPDQGCGDMVIPTVAIIRIINLKIPARKKRR